MTDLNKFLSKNAEIDESSWVRNGCRILDNAKILNGSIISQYSIIEHNAIVNDAQIADSYIKNNSMISDGCIVTYSNISDNVILYDDCIVINCNLSRNVKISGKILIYDLKISGNIHLHSNETFWIDIRNKKDLKRFVKSQDRTNAKPLQQIMDEELSIFECEEDII